MAADVVALTAAFRHDRFALAGHDAGHWSPCAAVDHPERMSDLAVLDVLPTLGMWDVLHGTTAAVGFHLYRWRSRPACPNS